MRIGGIFKEQFVNVADTFNRYALMRQDVADALLHGGDIAQNGCFGAIEIMLDSHFIKRFEFEEFLGIDRQAFDARRGHCFRSKDKTSKRFCIGEIACLFVKLLDGMFGRRNSGGCFRIQREVRSCEKVWLVGVVRSALSFAAIHTRSV